MYMTGSTWRINRILFCKLNDKLNERNNFKRTKPNTLALLEMHVDSVSVVPKLLCAYVVVSLYPCPQIQ